ncbi:hypothetical protein PYCC9005_001146 [Savitreella phatthalungensis]
MSTLTDASVDAAVSSLRSTEASLAFDGPARATSTAAEKSACGLLHRWIMEDRLREKMLDKEHLYLSVLDHIRRTRWHRAISRLPKAALLHTHWDASADIGVLLYLARRNPHIRVKLPTRTATPHQFILTRPSFSVGPVPSAITTLTLEPDTWYALSDLRRRISDDSTWQAALTTEFGVAVDGTDAGPLSSEWRDSFGDPLATELRSGEDAIDRWIRSFVSLRPCDVEPHTLSLNDVWSTFGGTFGVIDGLLMYETAFRLYAHAVFAQLYSDGIAYAEFRLNFAPEAVLSDDGTHEVGTHPYFLTTIESAHAAFKAHLPPSPCPTPHTWVGYKVIVCSLRFFPEDVVKRHLDEALALHRRWPDVVCGVDLVGQEDSGKSLRTWRPVLLQFRATCQSAGVTDDALAFILHAGETLARGHGADENVVEAIALGSRRLGHGVSVTLGHPGLFAVLREKGICIETCPVSNELLHLVRSVASHPLPTLMAAGVPCSINSDDGAILSNVGLSHDFSQALCAAASFDLISLRACAEASIEHSRLSDSLKRTFLESFRREWEAFCVDLTSTSTSSQ